MQAAFGAFIPDPGDPPARGPGGEHSAELECLDDTAGEPLPFRVRRQRPGHAMMKVEEVRRRRLGPGDGTLVLPLGLQPQGRRGDGRGAVPGMAAGAPVGRPAAVAAGVAAVRHPPQGVAGAAQAPFEVLP